MRKSSSLGFKSLTSAIFELNKIGENTLADKLLEIIAYNELPKTDKHNRKSDKTTSYYEINMSEEELEKIIDIFRNLEFAHLTEDGDTTAAASHYADLADRWQRIQAEL